MKFELESTPPRKLKAVYGVDGNCIFFTGYILHSNGTISKRNDDWSLEEMLARDRDRKPIYEGDTLTITF